jgi:hypothetical protein
MRYARDSADGLGLAWNPHAAPVEGYWFLTADQGAAARSELSLLGYKPIDAGMWVRPDSAVDLGQFRQALSRFKRR